MKIRLFDHHAHIADGDFIGREDEVIRHAKEEGVTHIIVPSCDLETANLGVNLANRYDNVYALVGTHPHEAKYLDAETLQIYESMAKNNEKVVAIGEIGLDYYYDHSPREIQKMAFIEQIRLAQTLNLPIVIHSRDAHKDTMDILKLEDAFSTGVIMHCYSSSAQMAKEYVKLGAYLSFAGPITYKNAVNLREAVENVPLDRLLVETDSPYLTPVPFRGKENQPRYVRHICEKMAEIKGVSFEEMAKITFENTLKAYRIKNLKEA